MAEFPRFQPSYGTGSGTSTIILGKKIAISEEVLFVMDDPVVRENLKMLRVDERTMRSNLDRLLRDTAALIRHCS